MDAIDGVESLPKGKVVLPGFADLGSFRRLSDQFCLVSRKYREDHALELIWGHVSSLGRWALESGLR